MSNYGGIGGRGSGRLRLRVRRWEGGEEGEEGREGREGEGRRGGMWRDVEGKGRRGQGKGEGGGGGVEEGWDKGRGEGG